MSLRISYISTIVHRKHKSENPTKAWVYARTAYFIINIEKAFVLW